MPDCGFTFVDQAGEAQKKRGARDGGREMAKASLCIVNKTSQMRRQPRLRSHAYTEYGHDAQSFGLPNALPGTT
jgi:hypothetical protein